MIRTLRRGVVACIGLLSLAVAGAEAQAPPGQPAELPREVALEVIDFYNDSASVRLMGDSRIAAGTELVGNLAVLEGTLTLAGTIRGSVAVVNGGVVLLPGATIEGDLAVVGGAVRGLSDSVRVDGVVSEYAPPLRFHRSGEALVYTPPAVEPALVAGREFGRGRYDLRLLVRGAYNRVEGLPVAMGGRITLGQSNPTWLEGLLIYRSAEGARLDPAEVGYAFRVEQYLGGRLSARVGATIRSEVTPIESSSVTDSESSLATFLLHADQRDHYERRGWGAYVRFARPGSPGDFRLEYRDERHNTVPTRGPWSIFDNDEPWRAQPVVAAGALRSLVADWSYDTRNDPADPAAGWFAEAEIEQGLGGTLEEEILITPEGPRRVEHAADRSFSALRLDLRRYARTGPDSRLAVRFLAAGSLDGSSLPPQRQHALGGVGSLPAFSLFAFDCGARADTVGVGKRGFFPYYGCDRAALVQLEYQGAVRLGTDIGRLLGLGVDLGETPRWVVFFDAGRAWTESEAREGRSAGLDDFVADAGAGIRLGRLGLYWAVPLSRRVEGANFFVRVGPRF